MNKEEILNKYIDLIDKGYCSDCNELNFIDNFPHAKITHAIRELQQENKELKKQLEEYKATNKILSHELTKDKILQQDCLTTCCGIPIGDIPKLITQQKEFIDYLENMLDNENDIFSVVRVKDVLSKYKEIIGGKDER